MLKPVPKPPKREPKQSKPIKRQSTKRAKENREYLKKRLEYLSTHPACLAKLKGCTGQASEVHHKRGRVGKLLTDLDHFLAVCRPCHGWIELHPFEAKQLGLSQSRLTTTNL